MTRWQRIKCWLGFHTWGAEAGLFVRKCRYCGHEEYVGQ